MAKKGLGLLLAGGAALLLMGGKKKKKKKSSDTGGGGLDDLPIYEDADGGGGLDDLPIYEDADGDGIYDPQPDSESVPTQTDPSRPAGKPPRGDSYDDAYWGPDLDSQLTNIRQHFVNLGYQVELVPSPMNYMGPKGTVEIENHPSGDLGKVGGGDDKPNETVRRFQKEYNIVSRLNKAEKLYPDNLGGLATDGYVGPQTLNALRYTNENQPKPWPDLIKQAELKGIR